MPTAAGARPHWSPPVSYMLVIMEPPGQRQARTPAQAREAWDRMTGFAADLKESGVLTMAESLRIDGQAVRVQQREGRPRIVDGPFAEAKEIVGGIFLLTCKTRDEALAIAARCPAAEWATVEVRAIGACFEDSL
jgi:hypothetical protein